MCLSCRRFGKMKQKSEVGALIALISDSPPRCPGGAALSPTTSPCNPRPSLAHQDLSAFSVTLISGGKEPVRVPTPEPVTAGHKSVCDKCGYEL